MSNELQTRISLHGYIRGRVQGVSFRQTTAEQAEQLGIDGWVRNLPDGRVEVMCEGERQAIEVMRKWLAQGPKSAKVETVELTEQGVQGIAGFIIR
ncbi:acylphosphatase [Pseudomonas sp. M30-35]|uniref:acylphosphatase n=1 Tax=Pseudomonas sp. M30-35 TaxID=1981174 RepID=UPI000B3BEAAC|nr:acylphosphatase [Pseudomonas sp. M30-35]ARU87808.1 acylphosphatase [Pseudomonas sp. M30-35]